ncbi:MAG: hypothetical protein HYW27_02620 [Candidatus Aenigmarchaeota archaeon]|nr:hypothetical protein [Candidatus Aenigmarchaeota archaeon]
MAGPTCVLATERLPPPGVDFLYDDFLGNNPALRGRVSLAGYSMERGYDDGYDDNTFIVSNDRRVYYKLTTDDSRISYHIRVFRMDGSLVPLDELPKYIPGLTFTREP